MTDVIVMVEIPKNAWKGITANSSPSRPRNGSFRGPGVDTDDPPEEQVSDQQEVQAHQLVAPVIANQGVEERGEVHDVQRGHKKDEGRDGVREKGRHLRVQQ